MYSGSISENRITIGLQPKIRQWLHEEAVADGSSIQEYLRHILRVMYERRIS